jgi:hypothetical protein
LSPLATVIGVLSAINSASSSLYPQIRESSAAAVPRVLVPKETSMTMLPGFATFLTTLTRVPQFGQKLTPDGSCMPQLEQNIFSPLFVKSVWINSPAAANPA